MTAIWYVPSRRGVNDAEHTPSASQLGGAEDTDCVWGVRLKVKLKVKGLGFGVPAPKTPTASTFSNE